MSDQSKSRRRVRVVMSSRRLNPAVARARQRYDQLSWLRRLFTPAPKGWR